MMRRPLIALLLLCSTALPTLAEKRVALVMAEDDYKLIRPLDNAVNDAQAIEESLEALGFEVFLETDRDLRRMRRALEDFREDAAGADVALVFFAGHGVEIAGENRLLPTDADATSIEALKQSSLPLEEVRQTVASIAKVGLIVLDACRNDPFGGGDGSGRGAKALTVAEIPEVKPGLGRLGKAENLLYTFSAAPGATAADGSGDNSPFTTALVKYLGTDGLEIRSVLTLVQQEVYDLSRGTQLPYVENGLPQLFFASTTTGDLPERERLLLAMADVTPELRIEVEKLAADNDMPLAPLYGALISSDASALSVEDRRKKLTEAAVAFVATRDQIRTMASSDPAVAQLREEAEKQLALGAFDTARGRLAEAADIDSKSRAALKDNFVERTASEASTHIIAGGASRTSLKYDLAIESYQKAASLFDEVDDQELPAEQRRQQLAVLETLGDLHLTVGNLAEGRKAYEQELATAGALAEANPVDADWQGSLASAILKLGDVQRDQGDSTAALASYEKGLDIRRKLAAGAAKGADQGAALSLEAAAYLQIGALHNLQGDGAKALEAYEQARGVLTALIDQDPANEDAKSTLARTFLLIGEAQKATNRLGDATASAQSGLTIASQMAEARPDDAQRQFTLASAYAAFGEYSRNFETPGDKAENSRRALEAFGLSDAILRKLIAADPKNAAYQRALAGTLEGNALAERFSQHQATDFDKVLASLTEAVEIRERLAGADATNKLWVGDLAATYANMATYWAFVPDDKAAIEYTKKAHAAALQLAALDPRNVDWQRKAWGYYAKISESYIQLKAYDEALRYEKDGLAYAERLAEANPGQEFYWQDVVVMQDRLARVFWVQKNMDGYWATLDKELATAIANEERFPGKLWALQDAHRMAMKIAGSWVQNDPDRALKLYDEARTLAGKAEAIEAEDPQFPSERINAYLEFGNSWQTQGNHQNARLAYDAALETFDKSAARNVDTAKFSYDRSHILERIGKVQ